ncbi:MAG TPA: hypothetical protein VLG38_02735 [Gammaproteobacteria bacterium]|nr:hypothetical protein [Gammaproteobacteria bacterium]
MHNSQATIKNDGDKDKTVAESVTPEYPTTIEDFIGGMMKTIPENVRSDLSDFKQEAPSLFWSFIANPLGALSSDANMTNAAENGANQPPRRTYLQALTDNLPVWVTGNATDDEWDLVDQEELDDASQQQDEQQSVSTTVSSPQKNAFR